MKRIINIALVLLIALTASLPGLAEPQISCSAVTDVTQPECEALVALYNGTNGPGWTDSTSWLETPTVDDWYGVVVADGHVRELLLANNNLSGPLLSELGGLTNLNKLVLNNNQLTGTIPLELTNLTALVELILRYNQLTGTIPPELGSMISLASISLDGNQLTGEIPAELGDLVGLTVLALSDNQLSGEIPPELGNLTGLNTIFLYRNQLTGEIPPELGNLVNMTWLELSGNQLTGEIPPELVKMTRLYRFMLGGNQLTGSVPAWLGDMTSLWTIAIEGNQFTGSIPPQLGNLPNLKELTLHYNQLTGSIPVELGNLTNLRRLYLHNNLLEGEIPISFVNLVNLYNTGVYSWDGLDLDYNFLTVPPDYPNPTDPLDAFILLKDPDWQLYQGFEQEIGPDGGEITSLDDSTDIVIPADTLDGATTFTFLPQPEPESEPGSLEFAGSSFLLSAEDSLGEPVTVFDPPLIVTLSYTEEQIAGMFEDSLALYYWDTDASAWLDAVTTCPDGEYTRDLAGNTLSLPVCHLSEFGVFGTPRLLTFLPAVIRK